MMYFSHIFHNGVIMAFLWLFILVLICSINDLYSFILRQSKLNKKITEKYCEFSYDDFKLTSIVPPDKLQELNNKLSKQQNSSVVEIRRYRIGNTSQTSSYKYIHSTNISAMVNSTLDEKFKELAEPLLDLELVAKTIEDWSRPLPTSYLTQPLVFVGPSGVGKGRLVAALLKDYSRFFKKVVTHTTRQPRPDEIERNVYNFITPEIFQQMVANNSFIEHATVHNNMYGTTIHSWKQIQFEGKIPIMEIDIQGARSIKKVASRYGIRPRYLFIRPPDVEKLRERLMLRGTENDAEMQLRLTNAVTELSEAGERGLFDAIIVNDDFESATRSFFRLIRDWYPAIPSAARIRMLQRRVKNIKNLFNKT